MDHTNTNRSMMDAMSRSGIEDLRSAFWAGFRTGNKIKRPEVKVNKDFQSGVWIVHWQPQRRSVIGDHLEMILFSDESCSLLCSLHCTGLYCH